MFLELGRVELSYPARHLGLLPCLTGLLSLSTTWTERFMLRRIFVRMAKRHCRRKAPFLFRSDECYHTLCLAAGTKRPSIGIR